MERNQQKVMKKFIQVYACLRFKWTTIFDSFKKDTDKKKKHAS